MRYSGSSNPARSGWSSTRPTRSTRRRAPSRTCWSTTPAARSPSRHSDCQPRLLSRRGNSAGEQLSHGERGEPLERHSAGGGRLDVEVFEGTAVREEVRELLAGRERGPGELVEPRRRERLPHRRVRPEGGRALAEGQVVAHAAGGRGPDAVVVLGARRFEVEVPRA